MESCIKLDNNDDKSGMCFPSHRVLLISFKSSSSTQIDSRSYVATVLKSFLFVSIRDAKQAKFNQTVFDGADTRSLCTRV